jgi:hypothetical protein
MLRVTTENKLIIEVVADDIEIFANLIKKVKNSIPSIGFSKYSEEETNMLQEFYKLFEYDEENNNTND